MATNTVVDLPVGLSIEPDYITIPGQQYALVSFVGPEFCRQKSGQFAMKIRGVFNTEEEAKVYVKRLQRSGDNIVDIFLVAMYQWCPIPPDPMAVQTQEYQETFLQELMSGYAESQRSAKEIFNDRKEKVMKDGLDAHLTPSERISPPTGPLPSPEIMPKFTKETIVEEEPEDIIEKDTIEKVFGADDPWMSRKDNV